MLEVGVDEITMVLQLAPSNKHILASDSWEDVAEGLICRFDKKSDLKALLGSKNFEQKAPAGYTHAYHYGEHSFYFAVAYHQFQPSMGVIIKFSAQALDFYCELSGLKVYQLMQKVSDSDYVVRLSRIDLTADYLDEGIDITRIYQSMIDETVGLFREYINKQKNEVAYRKIPMKYEGILKAKEVPTIYIGSVLSNSQLRIYDKKLEQIQKKGAKLDKALKCNDWVRFEGVFRNEYSHQLSEELMKTQTDDEFANLIASTLSQKYRFMEVDNGVVSCSTYYTQMLIDCLNNGNFKLRASSSKNFDLARSIVYIFYGSGIMNSMYKVKELWGIDAVKGLMEYLLEELKDGFSPNDDCLFWLKKNRDDYMRNFKDFDSFLRANKSILP